MSSETFSFNATEAAEILSKRFSTNSYQRTQNRDLERESRRAVNLELHIITIAEYLRVQRIPRGLRVPLQPTFFREDKDYCTKFEHILNKCSADLMTLTLSYLQKNLDTVNAQISAIENQLTSTMPQEKFQELNTKNQEMLRLHRSELEKKKRSKFLRDTEDYLQNRVYQWRDVRRSTRRHSSLSSSGSTDSRPGTSNPSTSHSSFLGNIRGRQKGKRGGGANAAGEPRNQMATRSQAGTIDSKMRDFLIKRDPITPIFYILPKIHKRLVKPPGRPIVSLTDSVLSPLSMVLEKILTPLVKTTGSFLLDTSNFIQIIKSLGPLAPSSLLITWDVNSLYTSIVHEKGLAATDRLLSENRVDIKIRHFYADLLGIVLKENYFMFQDTFYAQQQGTAMAANVAPPYAIAYMAAFESDFVYNHPLFMAHCRVWRRYIDDIFCVWDGPIESLLPFDQHINSIWPELKFTLQHDTHRISFLDTLVYKEREGRLGIDLFTKPTDRNGLLHFSSCHPPSIKRSIPKSQFHRVDRIVSDVDIKKTRLIEMEQKFTDRGYLQGVLTGAKQDLSHSKPKDNQKRIPFVSTFHPFSGLVQSTIRRHWNILSKSYPTVPEFKAPFLPCFKRARNLKDRLVKADIGSGLVVPKQTFLQTQKRGTFPCLNCLQCSNVQKGSSVFHPQTVAMTAQRERGSALQGQETSDIKGRHLTPPSVGFLSLTGEPLQVGLEKKVEERSYPTPDRPVQVAGVPYLGLIRKMEAPHGRGTVCVVWSHRREHRSCAVNSSNHLSSLCEAPSDVLVAVVALVELKRLRNQPSPQAVKDLAKIGGITGRKSVSKSKHRECATCTEPLPDGHKKKLCSTCIQRLIEEEAPDLS
ncbi:unnamed protein product [Ranitomeya imitator]|uniref:Reverse transcriptase domain-containing protein n=1 Tax=Ranitomeya imitator TaxID=111125 RepID=A0ABN9KVQ5_9NEOB|nr:unnamed protein product [Ranitomeya imitator]